ncbi:MAG TPA: RNA polymerase factor sigma-54 [Bacteroidales bacterium]|nr:RNA polymerase factor sigma-54 [Bacteroidales bacterium]HRZ77277.1 RNA polymerase factor sigma-54 [Bacteroidales bacterium]
MLHQKLQQKLLQKLSPQQILLMKLLQVPTIALEQRIKQEIEDNPALLEARDGEDEGMDEGSDDLMGDKAESGEERDEDTQEYDSSDDEFDLSDYMSDEDDIPEYRTRLSNDSPDDDYREVPFVSGLSFQDLLISQLGLRRLSTKQTTIGLHIIGNLDDSGYLRREVNAMIDDLAFTQNVEATRAEVEEMLAVVQQFDPAGVGARSLQECLLIQLRRKEGDDPAVRFAIHIMERHFNEFAKKHYSRILKKTGANEEDLKAAITEITHLNPKPGNSLGESQRTNFPIIPDFIVMNSDGELELTVNSRNIPDLRVNQEYQRMLETYAVSKGQSKERQKETVMFIKQKIDSARWFIDAIRQRQDTLFMTMKAIMDYQQEYFLTGDETKLRPMILKDIATIVRLDISTISRVANSKYVQTPFGTFLLKSFFSESMQKDDGEEVSTREIKKILTDVVEAEDKYKPLTDEQLMALLKDKGYPIARRTVAKYREQLGIPVARLRKEL